MKNLNDAIISKEITMKIKKRKNGKYES